MTLWLVFGLVIPCAASVGFGLGLVWGVYRHQQQRRREDAEGWRS